jgi:ATP-dependent DNA helicase RecG
MRSFSTDDFLALNALRTGSNVPERLRPRLDALRDLGLIESVGHGRGAKYMLARKWYVAAGDRAGYTRRRGLDRETNKELLLKHLRNVSPDGERLSQLCRVLPSLSYGQVRSLLYELKTEGRVYPKGMTRAGKWFASRKQANSSTNQFRPDEE